MTPQAAHVRRARGQAMVEYMVVVAAITFALFYPIKDVSSPDQPRTTVQIMVNGFREAYQNISAALSIPE
ncbi:hypothetical protein [Aquabacterium sp.]|uniref:hypothetical protein n=1 Tax=Aquabacterium sp. TaxID=1872578 RepID=UPI0024883676|nr:hypothetical protein [Aquabacterium sp.]MDI1260152.1 hypothetical protein [Aquabacterium sp.]